MNSDQRLLVVGVYLNSAIYLVGVFVASLFVQHGEAWKMALACAGLSYCAYSAQVIAADARYICAALVNGSVLAGLAAGIMLLF